MADESWERRVIEQIAVEGLREQTRARRWRIFFRLLTFAFLFIALFAVIAMLGATRATCVGKCTAQVEMRGELDGDGPVSADNVMAGLQAAFKDKGTQGVVLRINSPGGSPVQAGEINDEIRRTAQGLSRDSDLRGSRGRMRLGRVLRRRRDRQDLRRQGEPHRLDRRDH